MKIFNYLSFVFLMVFLSYSPSLKAVNSATNTHTTLESVFDLPVDDILQKDTKELEQQLGRKLGVKEKLGLFFTKRKLKKAKVNHEAIDFDEGKTHGLAIASLVCGIVGMFIFGLVLSSLAIIFGAISLNKIKRGGGFYRGKGLAIAGLILGIVGLALLALVLAAAF